jgi:hypothetical protein
MSAKGSKSEVAALRRDVCFAPVSGDSGLTVEVMTRWAARRGHPPRPVAGSLGACHHLQGPRDRRLSAYLRFSFL